jgi:hypothetical protein
MPEAQPTTDVNKTHQRQNAMAFKGKSGDRVRLVFMPNDPDPIPEGALGTVDDVVQLPWGFDIRTQVYINWDNGRTLACVCPPDHLEIIDDDTK